MSLLQIDKKAITQDDARALVDQTYGLIYPLGVPTVHLKPQDFKPHWVEHVPSFCRDDFASAVLTLPTNYGKAEMRAGVENLIKYGHLDRHPPHVIDDVLNRKQFSIGHDIIRSRLYDNNTRMYALPIYYSQQESHDQADAYGDEADPDPVLNIIVSSGVNAGRHDHIAYIADVPVKSLATSLPGYAEQLNFFYLWHEIGHGIGATEPQTEMIASIVSRQAFEDTAFMAMNADARAVHSLVNAGSKEIINLYGWPLVEASDYIRNMPEQRLSDIKEHDLRDLAYLEFDHLSDTVKEARNLIRSSAGGYFATRNRELLGMDAYAGAAYHTKDMSDDARQLLQRFRLACERLTLGKIAYEEPENYVSKELLDSEKRAPMTFDPDDIIIG